MFAHEGRARSPGKNALLAGYLAFVAGFVNSGGFILLGSFTSHVTGSVGHLANGIAAHDADAALFAGLLVVAFLAGAFSAALIAEETFVTRKSRAYGSVLLCEASLLAAFIFIAGQSGAVHTRALSSGAALLCLAMGMQNSLITRLSGSVIRTTHLTGIMTDLGIESAQWWRWYRAKPSATGERQARAPRPRRTRTLLLITISTTFIAGSIVGALLTMRAHRWAMLFPSLAILAMSFYAFAFNEKSSGASSTPVRAS